MKPFTMKTMLFIVMWWSLLLATPVGAVQVKYNETQLNQAIQENADDAHAWFRLGVLQTHDGRILQAMEAFRQVIRIKPNAVEPHHNLAAIYESLDDFDAAADELKQVIELAPRDVQSQVELAGIYLKQADGIYRGIARRDPENRAIKRDHLAQLMCRQSLAKVSDNNAMEAALQRMISPSLHGPAANQRFPVPEKVLRSNAASVSEHSKKRVQKVVKPKVVHHSKRPMVVHQHRAKRVLVSSNKKQLVSSNKKLKRRVLAAVEAWRRSWESRNAARYIAFYSDDFVPPKWSLKLWHAHKANVFRKAKFVRVHLTKVRVKILGKLHARVTFDQDYRSDYYQARSRKMVTWVNEKGVWKVLRETSIEMSK